MSIGGLDMPLWTYTKVPTFADGVDNHTGLPNKEPTAVADSHGWIDPANHNEILVCIRNLSAIKDAIHESSTTALEQETSGDDTELLLEDSDEHNHNFILLE
jgi:hypothetical protein